MIRDKMAQIDSEKDPADEEMMKEMARFESESRLHLLRTTPPEDRVIPFSEQVDCEYQGWIRSVYEDVQIVYGSSDWGRDYGSVYMKERIEPSRNHPETPNDRGYALAVCDYGLLHIATKHLCRVPEIGETILATIAPIDVRRKMPFPLTTIYIH